jgi:hypothetical protein
MALRDMSKPYGAREIAQVALDADCTPDTVRLVLSGAPLNTRTRMRIYRLLAAAGKTDWIKVPT